MAKVGWNECQLLGHRNRRLIKFTLCSSLHRQTSFSAAALLALYNTPGGVFRPSALSFSALSNAVVAKSDSVNTVPAGLLASNTAAAEEVMTTDESCGPVLRAESRIT